MQFSAIEHRSTDNFCCPLNERELAIGIKTGSDIKRVFIIYGDPFDGSVTQDGWKWDGARVEITLKKELPHHVWRQIIVAVPHGRCKYCFELHGQNDDVRYYLENGFYTADELAALRRITGNFQGFVFPWLDGAEHIRIPDWVRRTVWYQIFPDRFCGDKGSPHSSTLPWPGPEDAVTNDEHYGGTLRGITEKLDYLAGLNITGLYLNPINASPSVHKYDTSDYLTIDPAFGTAADLRTLVAEAHARGIKVMPDGVFNHCGWDFAPWQDVVRNGSASPYFDWFIVKEWPFETVAEPECETAVEPEAGEKTGAVQVKPAAAAGRNRPSGTNGKSGRYGTFAYVDTMPKLNTDNQSVIDYLLTVCETWVRSYDIDGIRLDVANELSHTFCRQLYRRMRSLKKDFYVLGEIWHNAVPWLRGGELDSVMNYPLALCIWKFFYDKTLPACSLEREINAAFTTYPAPVHAGLFNLLDSHDTPRLITRNGGDVSAVWQQYALLFMLPGSPCIYYGSETLLAGGDDPDSRRCMPWQAIESGVYDADIAMMRHLIELRRTHPAMAAEEYSYLHDIPFTGAEPDRVLHLQKHAEIPETAQTDRLPRLRSIDLILNCGTSPVSIAHIIDEKTRIFVSLHCREKTILPGGFIFFEHG